MIPRANTPAHPKITYLVRFEFEACGVAETGFVVSAEAEGAVSLEAAAFSLSVRGFGASAEAVTCAIADAPLSAEICPDCTCAFMASISLSRVFFLIFKIQFITYFLNIRYSATIVMDIPPIT